MGIHEWEPGIMTYTDITKITPDMYDEWLPELAPPLKLVGDLYIRKKIKPKQFKQKYLEYIHQPEINKVIRELAKRSTGNTLYLLDEPTTGLHFHDTKKLISVLNDLVNKGNTVIVIEHNLDVIKSADHIIDLGPEGGDGGGEVICTGTPHEIANCKKSYTGQFLKKIIDE